MTHPRATRKPARSGKASKRKQRRIAAPVREPYWIDADAYGRGHTLSIPLPELPEDVLEKVKDDLTFPTPQWYGGRILGQKLLFVTPARISEELKKIIARFREKLKASIARHAPGLLRSSKAVSYPQMAKGRRRTHVDKHFDKSPRGRRQQLMPAIA